MSCIKCLCIKSFAENVVGTRMNGCIRTQNLTFYVKHKKKKKQSKRRWPLPRRGRIRFFSRRDTATRGKHHTGRMTSKRHFLSRFDPRAARSINQASKHPVQFCSSGGGAKLSAQAPIAGMRIRVWLILWISITPASRTATLVRQNIEQRYSSERRLNTQ